MSGILPLAMLLLAAELAAGDGEVPTAAEAEAALTFQFQGCPEQLAREVEELVRADVSWAPGDPPVALTVRCEDARVTLLLAGDDSRVAERKLELATTPPEARARTTALIATELILVGRKSPPPVLPVRRVTAAAATDDPGAPAPASPTEVVPLRRSPPSRRRRPALLAVFGSSLQAVAQDVPMFDAGARGRLPVARAFDLAADARALYQRRTSAYGTSQGLGGQVSLLGEARLGFLGGAVRPGFGVRAAALRIAAAAADGAVSQPGAWGASVGPMARLAVTAEGAHLAGELALEGGWSGPDVVGTAAGGSPVGVGGWWAGVSLAAGWLAGVD